MLEADEKTDKILLIGEIGGDAEEQAAAYIQKFINETGHRLYCRTNSATRKNYGPCWRYHFWEQGWLSHRRSMRLETAGVQVAVFPHDGSSALALE